MSARPRPLRDRLFSRLIRCADPGCECLLWTGARKAIGYGVIQADGGVRQLLVHRAVWELENGPVPAGLEIDHVRDRGCRHRHCANVKHLEPVTHLENLRRSPLTFAGKALRAGSEATA